MPSTMAATSVVRKERVTCCAVATGTTISAETSSSPTVRIATVTLTAASTATSDVVGADVAARRPGRTPGPARPRTAAARARRTTTITTAASAIVHQTSPAEIVVIEPKRYSCSRRRALAAEAGEQHAAGQAAVEEQGQRDVAVGVAALADHLDQHRAEHGHHDRGPGRGGAGEQAERDAGDGHVADAVAHQGQPALHQVGADGGGGQAGEQRGEQGPLHEGEGEQVHQAHPCRLVAASSGDATCGRVVVVPVACRVVVVVVVRARRSRGGAPRGRPAAGRRSRSGRRASRPPGRPAAPAGRARGRPARSVAPRSLSRPRASASATLVGQVDAGGRLVEEEQLRLAGQRSRDQRALLLAAGQRGDAVAGPVARARPPRGRRRWRPGRPATSGRSRRRRVSRPAATTSHTEAGTPDVAPVRCGTKPTRCQS